MESYTSSCYEFLLNKNIRVQKIWIEACIEWVQEEHKKLPLKHELFNILYEQWLMADLREVAEGVLPSSLNKGAYMLNGLFALQVNSAMDIGHSAYSQLQKTKGQEIIDTGNEDINEFFGKGASDKVSINESKWKEVSSRMLLLDITDGSKAVEGIEYQPFKDINLDSLQPGCKVMIKGPVQCRNNLMLLKQENIQILGGNVESLLESNTIEKLLCKVLETEHDAKPNIKRESNSKVGIIKVVSQKVPQKNSKNKSSERVFSIDDKNIFPIRRDIKNCDSTVESRNRSSLDPKQQTSTKINQSLNKSIKTELSDDFFENDVLDNFPIDDLGLLEFPELNNVKSNLNDNKVNKTSSVKLPKQCFLKNEVLCSNLPLSDNKFNNTHLSDNKKYEPDNNFNKKYEQGNNFNKKYEPGINSKKKDELDNNFSKKYEPNNYFNKKYKPDNNVNKKYEPEINFNKKYEADNIECELDVDADLFSDDVDIISNLNCKSSNEITFCKTSSNETKVERGEAKTKKKEITYNGLYGNQFQYLSNKDSLSAKEFQSEKVCSSLSDFANPINTVVNVKCWFQTLTSKLEFQDFFKISGIITDGMKNIEVILTDEVLFSIIGYSSKEVLAAVNGKLPSSHKSSVKQALKNAEQCLEKGKWLAKIYSDANIYKVVEMTQLK